MKKNFTAILFIASFLFVKTNIVCAQVNTQDSLALVDFYHSTKGSQWILHTNWLTAAPVSTWIGITVEGNRVTEMDFLNSGVNGPLSASFGNLTALKKFSANYGIKGALPSTIGNCTALESLAIFFCNQFNGHLPSSIGNLKNLQYLYLYSDNITGTIPSSIGNLTNLKSLNLAGSLLKGGIPISLNKLTNLEELDLSFNRLSGTIPSLSNLTKLTNLKLEQNRFTFSGMENIVRNFPFAGYWPQAVDTLNKNNNTLSVYAGGAVVLPDNTYKWYKGSTLIATITGDSTFTPTQSGNYSVAVTNSVATKLTLYSDTVYVKTTINKNDSLALVDLYNSTNGPNWHDHLNWLTSAPVSTWYGIIVTGSRVTELHLGLDNLGGKIPVSIGNLTELNYLDFSYGHNLHGSIPASIGNLINLSYINFNSCKLNGAIPESVGNFVKLETLYLDDNNLSGEIPSSLANLTNLKILDIGFNKLSGVIPSQLTGLTNLTNLILLYNNFTFAGMGKIATAFPFAAYSPQAKILLHINNNILSVTAGSSVKNNAYKWYKNGTLYKTKVGDSTISVTDEGDYSVVVTNSIATKLTLYSDTIKYIVADNSIASKMNNNSSISLYPNPTKTFATISFNADGKYSITITDISGRILQTKAGVANKSTNVIQLDVSKYANSIYLVTITDEKNRKQTLRLNKE